MIAANTTRKLKNGQSINRSSGSDFFNLKTAYLHLADGTSFEGLSPQWQAGNYDGEVVFNTGMTGYVESLTDPSYHGQILVFTYPLIGNYGVQLKDIESSKIQASGVVVSEVALHGSHADSAEDFMEWLRRQNIPLLTGVDSRALTKHLRVGGVTNGRINRQTKAKGFTPTLTTSASNEPPVVHNAAYKTKVILVDCGAKGNILKSLLALPIQVIQVPADYDYTKQDYDGVLLSNGSGDPTSYKTTITILKKALKQDKPIFGICLGSQLLGLAAGAKTYKLLFGHRGHNQPCLQTDNERCFITSQNHGYAINEKSLPKEWRVSFRNLNDDSVEGIEHTSKPFFAVQFHPEACPGPTDTAWLFEKFHKAVKRAKR